VVKTASKAQNIFGQKLYQIRAREALPRLVRQAQSKNPIFYEDLAIELGMRNPRNLNFVLGSIGTTIDELSLDPDWGEIPHIQSLVINQHEELPGTGFEAFLAQRLKEYRGLSLQEKKAYLQAYWLEIYAYPYWNDVLEACDLSPVSGNASKGIERAKNGRGNGGGEGPEHKKLKEYVAANPVLLGLSSRTPVGKPEAPLPSGDRIDVLFETRKIRLAAEVKSIISNKVDLIRGLFQCVKYRAVMEAERDFSGENYSVDALLVSGRALPKSLYALKNSLGVKVVEVLDDL